MYYIVNTNTIILVLPNCGQTEKSKSLFTSYSLRQQVTLAGDDGGCSVSSALAEHVYTIMPGSAVLYQKVQFFPNNVWFPTISYLKWYFTSIQNDHTLIIKMPLQTNLITMQIYIQTYKNYWRKENKDKKERKRQKIEKREKGEKEK